MPSTYCNPSMEVLGISKLFIFILDICSFKLSKNDEKEVRGNFLCVRCGSTCTIYTYRRKIALIIISESVIWQPMSLPIKTREVTAVNKFN